MRKTVNNIIYNGVYQLLILALPIITMPYVSRVLGRQALGKYSFVSSIAMLLSYVILMGMNQLGARVIARTPKDDGKLSKNFFELWQIQLLVGCLVIAGYTIFSLYSSYRRYLLLNIPYLIAFALDISWFFIGLGEIRKVVIRNTLIKVSSIALIFIFVKSPADLGYYILINSISILVANIIFWTNLRSLIQWKFISSLWSKSQFWRESLVLIVPQLAVQFYTNFDSTLVGMIAGPTQLTYYDQSQRIVRMMVALVTSVSTVLMPKMSELKLDNKNHKIVNRIFKVSLDYTLIIALMMTAVLMIDSAEFVPWFYGKSYSPMIDNMLWVSLIMIFISYGGVFGSQFTLVNGDYKKYAIPSVIAAVFSVSANVILVHFWQADGGTLVVILTELLVCFMRIFVVRKEVNLKEIFHEQPKYLLAFVMTTVLGLKFKLTLPSAFLTLVINSILAIVVYVVLLIILKTRILADIKNRNFLSDDE